MNARTRRIILSIIGIVAGFFAAGTYINKSGGGDLGFLFLPLGFLYSAGLVLFLNSVAEILLGSPKAKKVAVVLLIILALVVAWGIFESQKSDQTHYCNGKPASQYPGPLPAYCKY